uniref:Asn/Gln amidotransferase domain-containing protein n=1 Tax=Rhodosorus marinus TaxID=101924 RepID=A0A7S0G6E6_9RHOD|mmetsp:Transcript_23998/g.34524  ORF Transcript_23998/g.34524 Transcript_23998/m.34524 type:complete len:189 (+) Transcript_23998:242-808(+)
MAALRSRGMEVGWAIRSLGNFRTSFSGSAAGFHTLSPLLVSLADKISDDMKAAMKSRDADRLKPLRAMRARFVNKMKETGADSLSDHDATALLKSLAKQYSESIELYEQAKRPDLVASEKAELKIVRTYLPKLADEATVQKWVDEALTELGAGKVNVGRAMGMLMKSRKGAVDPILAKKLIEDRLQGA